MISSRRILSQAWIGRWIAERIASNTPPRWSGNENTHHRVIFNPFPQFHLARRESVRRRRATRFSVSAVPDLLPSDRKIRVDMACEVHLDGFGKFPRITRLRQKTRAVYWINRA
jgi:hypothetical protein